MRKKAVAFHFCTDEFNKYGEKMRRSFKKFHPDIPFIRIDQPRITELLNKYGTWWYGKIGEELIKEYKLVVQIDADSCVAGRLSEVFDEKRDWEVASVLNGSVGGFNTTLAGVANVFKYLNAGFVASSSKKFWEEWSERTIRTGYQYAYGEQDILNLMVHKEKKYKTKILDGEGSKVFYGSSTIGHYKDMYMEGDKVMLYKKQVKCLHTAGQRQQGKLWFGDCPQDVFNYLSKLMGEF